MGWLFGKKKENEEKEDIIEPKPVVSQKEVLSKLKQSTTYTTVTITRCGCGVASKFIGKSFSFDEVPSLPLPGCTASTCTCEYQGNPEHRHADRRVNERREALRMEDDRRKSPGRRKGDLLWTNNDF